MISDLAAPSTGVYYFEVTGAAGVAYDLVVTRGADFGLHGNSFDKAQPLNGVDVALGSILPTSSPLYLLDDQLSGAFNPIYLVDPATGDFTGPAIAAPGSPLNDPSGLNMAYDGTYLYYNDGPNSGDNTIHISSTPTPVRSLASFLLRSRSYPPWELPTLTAIFGERPPGSISSETNPNTVARAAGIRTMFSRRQCNRTDGSTQIWASLFAVSQSNTLYEIDPTTASDAINSGPDNADRG